MTIGSKILPSAVDGDTVNNAMATTTLNWCFQFQNVDIRRRFLEWTEDKEKEERIAILNFFVPIFLLLAIATQVSMFAGPATDRFSGLAVATFVVSMIMIFFACIASILKGWTSRGWICRYCDLSTLELLVFLLTTVGGVVSMLMFNASDDVMCSDNYLRSKLNCGEGSERDQHTLYMASCQSLMLIVCFLHCPTVRIEFVWIVWLLDIITFIALARPISSGGSMLGTLLFWAVCVLAVMLELHMQKIVPFLLTVRIEEDAIEQASRMRHSIANVAHDLKTPLASFSNSIELHQMLWEDLTSAVRRGDDEEIRSCSQQMEMCIKSIRCTTAFMSMSINRCLDSTKASDNLKLVPKNETVSLLEALTLPLMIMRTLQSKIGVALEVDKSIEQQSVFTHVITDQHWLQENLLCLLSNAVKYSSKGQVVVRLSKTSVDSTVANVANRVNLFTLDLTSTRDPHPPQEEMLVFEVEDEGIGVSPEARQKLFSPFQQSMSLAGGTGLGLYSLAKRMEAIHGHYGIHSRNDGLPGSVFWFSIPYRPDLVMSDGATVTREEVLTHCAELLKDFGGPPLDPISIPPETTILPLTPSSTIDLTSDLRTHSPCATPRSVLRSRSCSYSPNTPRSTDNDKSPASPSHVSWTSPLRLLVVDDAPMILKVSSSILRRSGCDVVTAENGAEALEALEAAVDQPFDLMLTDLQMPVMDGLEATKRLRKHPNRSIRNLAVVGMSANADQETVATALDAGMTRFLAKPLTMEGFLAIVKDLYPQHLASGQTPHSP